MAEIDYEKLAQATAKCLAREINKRADSRNRNYHNTEELLKNYRLLKDHVDYAVCSGHDVRTAVEKIDEMKNEFYENYDEEFLQKYPDLFIETILKSRVRTALMVAHVDVMLAKLRKETEENGKQWQWQMFENVRIKGQSYEIVAEDIPCAASSVYRHVKIMTLQLSVMLWGMDGLRLW